jgi:hypothetical protein
MQRLRNIHLYLGCVFAPLLLFFGNSGIWQSLGVPSRVLTRLSTIHTTATLKNGGDLSTPALRAVVVVMDVSFLLTTILGIVMAFRFGRSRRAVMGCLGMGVLVPLALIMAKTMR